GPFSDNAARDWRLVKEEPDAGHAGRRSHLRYGCPCSHCRRWDEPPAACTDMSRGLTSSAIPSSRTNHQPHGPHPSSSLPKLLTISTPCTLPCMMPCWMLATQSWRSTSRSQDIRRDAGHWTRSWGSRELQYDGVGTFACACCVTSASPQEPEET